MLQRRSPTGILELIGARASVLCPAFTIPNCPEKKGILRLKTEIVFLLFSEVSVRCRISTCIWNAQSAVLQATFMETSTP